MRIKFGILLILKNCSNNGTTAEPILLKSSNIGSLKLNELIRLYIDISIKHFA